MAVGSVIGENISGASRREFLKQSAWVAGMGVWVATEPRARALEQQSPNERVNVACIGLGGKGDSDSDQASMHANIVAICDVDGGALRSKAGKDVNRRYPFQKSRQFSDFRKMFDEVGKSIDAVTVSIPDHMHAAATMMAMKMGKAVYTQKPLTHDVWEARQLRLAAREHNVVTQMGNQGTAGSKFREGVEVIRAGLLGDVREVHVWTNRPIWPQAPELMTRPPGEPVPDDLKWITWLGTAPVRGYNRGYHPNHWRGFWDFGTGAIGDMGCHLINLPFMALNLGHPSAVTAEAGDVNNETYQSWARIAYEFPARGAMPPVKVVWYEGKRDGKLVLPPPELIEKTLADYGEAQAPDHKKDQRAKRPDLPSGGAIVVGDKGVLYSPHDYGGAWTLLPGDAYRDYKAPPQTLPRNKNDSDEGMKIEWIDAIKGGRPPMSNFDYAGMLTEMVLLANVAVKHNGKRLEWDGPNMKFPNAPEAEQLLRREYRAPWAL
jgi:predicted dehydrogenase